MFIYVFDDLIFDIREQCAGEKIDFELRQCGTDS